MLRAASREYQPLALPVAVPATRAIGWPANHRPIFHKVASMAMYEAGLTGSAEQ